MRKSEVKKLRKGQIVYYGDYEWKFYKFVGIVNGIDKESLKKMENKQYDDYRIILKAIDGKFYPMFGQYHPKDLNLDKIYWLGTSAKYKDVYVK